MFTKRRILTVLLAASICHATPGPRRLSIQAAEVQATTTSTLLPIPELASQRQELDVLKKVFKDEYEHHAPEQRAALARTFVQQSANDNTLPPMRFVMLQEAMDLASGAGDVDVACVAIDAMARGFAVDALDLKVQAMARAAAAARTVNQWENIVNDGLPLLDAAVRQEQFASGQRVAQLVEVAVVKSKHAEMVAAVQSRTADFRSVMTAYTTAQGAANTLKQSPVDEAANLSAGIYTCFVRGDWKAGLLHLAAGSDERMKTVAVKEIAAPQEPVRQLELADRWWEIGESYKGWMQREIRHHAAEWYTTALKNLNGVTLARINTRISLSTNAVANPHEKTIDLLAGLDVAKATVEGTWKVSNGVLASDDSKYARVTLSYLPPEEYDLRLEFVRGQDKSVLAGLLAEGKTAFGFTMGVQSNKTCRFESVGHHVHAGNPTEIKLELQRDHKYILVLQVRKDGVKAILDGKTIDQYTTDYKDLSRYNAWKLPDERSLGLGSSNGAVLIYSAEVVEIGGEGKRTK
jgi:hypothetical protein